MSELSSSLSRYINAINKLKRAEESCHWDAGYFLQGERDDVEDAEKDFLDELLEQLEARKQQRPAK